MTEPTHTRRALLAGGAAAVPLLAGASESLARARDDRQILSAAIVLERRAALTYRTAATSGRLRTELAGLARHHAGQEADHADGLMSALRGPAPAAGRPRELPGLERALRGGDRAFAAFAIGFEDQLLAAYYAAVPRLRPGLRQPLASIMGCEGQHLVALREVLGRNPLPRSFEDGAATR